MNAQPFFICREAPYKAIYRFDWYTKHETYTRYILPWAGNGTEVLVVLGEALLGGGCGRGELVGRRWGRRTAVHQPGPGPKGGRVGVVRRPARVP